MDKMTESTHKKQALKLAWKAKCEQVVAKARLSMSDDKTTLDMVEKWRRNSTYRIGGNRNGFVKQ